jgi:hypothetical protein
VIEASLAQPGQHFICSYLERRDVLPAFREGMDNITADEQRHIGFGVKLLSDLKREDPVGVPKAVAQILRDVTRYTSQVVMPPGWDESYLTVFGSNFQVRHCSRPACLRWRSPSAGAHSPKPA